MRRREAWMKRGANVFANGVPGKITSMEQNTVNGVDYVYYINVRVHVKGIKRPQRYHPNDINERREK